MKGDKALRHNNNSVADFIGNNLKGRMSDNSAVLWLVIRHKNITNVIAKFK